MALALELAKTESRLSYSASIKKRIREVKDEIAHAGKYHKRDLTKYLHRLQKEMFIIEREQQKSVADQRRSTAARTTFQTGE